MSTPEEGFEQLSTVGMVRYLRRNLDHFDDGSPAQVLYLYMHLNLILMSALEDLSALTSDQLFNAQNLIDLYQPGRYQ